MLTRSLSDVEFGTHLKSFHLGSVKVTKIANNKAFNLISSEQYSVGSDVKFETRDETIE